MMRLYWQSFSDIGVLVRARVAAARHSGATWWYFDIGAEQFNGWQAAIATSCDEPIPDSRVDLLLVLTDTEAQAPDHWAG